jgi:hypothetical protein
MLRPSVKRFQLSDDILFLVSSFQPMLTSSGGNDSLRVLTFNVWSVKFDANFRDAT